MNLRSEWTIAGQSVVAIETETLFRKCYTVKLNDEVIYCGHDKKQADKFERLLAGALDAAKQDTLDHCNGQLQQRARRLGLAA